MQSQPNKFDAFIRRPSLKLYMLAVVSLVLAGVFFKDYIITPRIHSAADLETVEGTLDQWWRAEMSNGGVDFTFTLNEYKSAFKVHGKFFGFAYLQKFQNEMEKGDPLMLRVPKYNMDKLKVENAIIYPVGIWDDQNEYVEKDKALKRELRPGDLYMALGALGAALFFGLIGWLMDKSKKPARSQIVNMN